MALYFLIAYCGIVSFFSLLDWRKGLYGLVIAALIVDPLRKIVPGAPSFLLLLPIMIILCISFGLLLDNRRRLVQHRSMRAVKRAVALFYFLILPACALSASFGVNSWMFTILGIFSYSVLLMSIFAGYYFARAPIDLSKFLSFYCIAASIILVGAWIEYLDLPYGGIMIGTSALNMNWIRYGDGFTVDLIAGFFRSPDVMGWHAASVSIFSMILLATAKPKNRWFWALVCVFALATLIICGRRKMIYIIPLFIFVNFAIMTLSGRSGRLFSAVQFILPVIASVFIAGGILGQQSSYVLHAFGTSEQATEQFKDQSFSGAVKTLQQVGFFGAGLGFATPGAQNIPAARPRLWQESGTSRVLAELGVPGTVGLFLLIMTLLRKSIILVKEKVRALSSSSWLVLGMFSFFISNLGSLTVSGQILADPFIAFLIGFSIGCVLAFEGVRLRAGLWRPVASVSL